MCIIPEDGKLEPAPIDICLPISYKSLMKSAIRLINLSVFLIILTGCKPGLIPNTSLKDNDENMALTVFMAAYKNAIEARDVDAVLNLVADDYFQKPDEKDKSDKIYGKEQLRSKLEEAFAHISDVSLGLHIQHVYNEANLYEVVYYFTQQAMIDMPTGKEWSSLSDVNRMIIRQKGPEPEDGFEIVSGL